MAATPEKRPVAIARPRMRHAWNVTPKEAIRIQERLRDRVLAEDRLGKIRIVAGVDAHFDRGRKLARAAVATFVFPDLEPREEATAEGKLVFPYVPGLLSFREVPPVLEALDRLQEPPDLLLCDAHGTAHPRRFGMACHLGVLVDTPTVGVAKSRLVGEHDEVPRERGGWVPLRDRDEVIGAVLRTRSGVRPVFVSVGHRVSLATAIELVLACTPRYRLPLPTRRADRLAEAG